MLFGALITKEARRTQRVPSEKSELGHYNAGMWPFCCRSYTRTLSQGDNEDGALINNSSPHFIRLNLQTLPRVKYGFHPIISFPPIR